MCPMIAICLFPALASGVVVTLSPLRADMQTPELERLAGMWGLGEELVHVTVEDGVAKVVDIGWDGTDFVQRQGELTVTQGEHRSFVSVAGFHPDLPSDQFLFAQYRLLSTGDLVVWRPRIDTFRAAAEQGQLTASDVSSEDRLVLDTDSDALLDFLDDPLRTDAFDYENPIVLRKTRP